MGTFYLSAEAGFSAAHTLPGVAMCDRMHGHNWRVQVTVRLAEGSLDSAGMGVDFRTLERLVTESVADFEHRYLNDLPEFADGPPSAERLTRIVAGRLGAALAREAPTATISEVALWEMPQYRVIYRPDA
jgi:6-pyruvoyltetrahydropterin/6-carboxytetrahydropterin synthase